MHYAIKKSAKTHKSTKVSAKFSSYAVQRCKLTNDFDATVTKRFARDYELRFWQA